VAAHLIMPLTLGMGTVLAAMAASMGNFDKTNIKLTAKVADRSISEIAAQLRAQAENKFTPPGMGFEAPLTDALVHGEDFRRPLGIEHQFDPEALRTSLGFVATKKGSTHIPRQGTTDGAPIRRPRHRLVLRRRRADTRRRTGRSVGDVRPQDRAGQTHRRRRLNAAHPLTGARP
jgi:hypothetical protein